MNQYIKNKLEFNGTPETLNPLAEKLKSDGGNDPLSFSKIIPLNNESEMEEKWGIPSEPEEMDWVLYHNQTILNYEFYTNDNIPLPIFEKLAEIYPEYDMKVEYASDDYGENCGIYKKEANSSKLVFEEPDEPFEFACLLWDRDPDEEKAERMINEYEE